MPGAAFWHTGWRTPVDKSVEVFLNDGKGNFILHNIYTVYPNWMLASMSDAEREAIVTHFKCSLYDDLDISLNDIFMIFCHNTL